MAAPLFRITPVYDVLLRGSAAVPLGLYHLHLATAEQLCRLHYRAGSIKAIKARLKTLTEQGYVLSDTVPTRQFRAPYYYTLAAKGVKYLAAAGMDAGDLRAGRELGKHALFVDHTLELNDLLIAAALIEKTDPHYSLARFIHERNLKRTPYHVRSGEERFTLIPDAFLEFHRTAEGMTRRMPLLLEHDRGTEEQSYFRRRIRAYIAFLQSQAQAELFGTRAITVAFTTFIGQPRVDQMRAWTRAELDLTDEPKHIALSFRFAHLERPLDPRSAWFRPCWYTVYENGKPATSLLTPSDASRAIDYD